VDLAAAQEVGAEADAIRVCLRYWTQERRKEGRRMEEASSVNPEHGQGGVAQDKRQWQ